MPVDRKRYQQAGTLPFITFSCYRRLPGLKAARARRVFEQTLERVRRWYGFYVTGYVVMPEHVHLLMSEPERSSLAVAIQMLKQITAKELLTTLSPKIGEHRRFWQVRYYDFNVRTEKKGIEKLKYMHRNPVKRGLVKRPEDWAWSSFCHYLTGEEGVVEIESWWTGRRRERMGFPLRLSWHDPSGSHPIVPTKDDKGGAPTVS